jgi:hypothetical protein
VATTKIISRLLLCALAFGSLLPVVSAQQIALSQQTWSAEVIRPRGQPVIPLYDGWFPNEDGTRTLCYSFFNLNTEQTLSIPLGADNYLSDDRFAAILPTHFDPLPPRYRHKFCVFTISVPESFASDETIVWHLSSAGQSLSVPGHTKSAYVLDEPFSDGRGDIAPLIKLTAAGEGARGRLGIHNKTILTGKVGEAVSLTAWIEHPDPEVWIGWAKHSGPGSVEFSDLEYTISPNQGPTQVHATFSEAGDYTVRLQSIDDVAAFEFYCCHSNAYYRINITN